MSHLHKIRKLRCWLPALVVTLMLGACSGADGGAAETSLKLVGVTNAAFDPDESRIEVYNQGDDSLIAEIQPVPVDGNEVTVALPGEIVLRIELYLYNAMGQPVCSEDPVVETDVEVAFGEIRSVTVDCLPIIPPPSGELGITVFELPPIPSALVGQGLVPAGAQKAWRYGPHGNDEWYWELSEPTVSGTVDPYGGGEEAGNGILVLEAGGSSWDDGFAINRNQGVTPGAQARIRSQVYIDGADIECRCGIDYRDHTGDGAAILREISNVWAMCPGETWHTIGFDPLGSFTGPETNPVAPAGAFVASSWCQFRGALGNRRIFVLDTLEWVENVASTGLELRIQAEDLNAPQAARFAHDFAASAWVDDSETPVATMPDTATWTYSIDEALGDALINLKSIGQQDFAAGGGWAVWFDGANARIDGRITLEVVDGTNVLESYTLGCDAIADNGMGGVNAVVRVSGTAPYFSPQGDAMHPCVEPSELMLHFRVSNVTSPGTLELGRQFWGETWMNVVPDSTGANEAVWEYVLSDVPGDAVFNVHSTDGSDYAAGGNYAIFDSTGSGDAEIIGDITLEVFDQSGVLESLTVDCSTIADNGGGSFNAAVTLATSSPYLNSNGDGSASSCTGP